MVKMLMKVILPLERYVGYGKWASQSSCFLLS